MVQTAMPGDGDGRRASWYNFNADGRARWNREKERKTKMVEVSEPDGGYRKGGWGLYEFGWFRGGAAGADRLGG